MNIINVENITKSYTGRKLFAEASFYVQEHEKIGIIGINGTGKSTLLKIIAGQEEPDEGKVTKANHIVISYLSQNPDLDPDGSVIDEVMKKVKTTELDEHLKWSLESDAKSLLMNLDITDFEQKTGELSGGQRKRVALVAAVLKPCDVLILDEPTNHLDYEMVEWLEDFLRKFRGARARSTKQKAHIQRYEALRDQKGPMTDGKVELSSVSSRMGRTTIELSNISKSYGNIICVDDFSYIFLKNDRIGFVGKNGCGKTTLMKMIAGFVEPDSGEIEIGQTIKIGYYGQEISIDPDIRVIDYIKEAAEYVRTNDGLVSASAMLERFLFPPEQQYSPVGKLSGGEKRRLHLLRVLMTAPNVLIMDEPTNDLDTQTLAILEDYLDNYEGIVITVSHDRYFLDRIARRIFAFEGNGRIVQYEGGYSDYMAKRPEPVKMGMSGSTNEKNDIDESNGEEKEQTSSKQTWKHEKKVKFSYNEKREYETIEADIEKLENQIAELDEKIMKNASDFGKLNALTKEKDEVEAALLEKMDRWEYLEEIAQQIE